MGLMPIIRRAVTGGPSWLAHVYWTARGVKHLLNELGPGFREHLRALMQSQWWDEAAIRAHQDRCAAEVVRYAYAHVPFWRGWLDRAGVRPQQVQCADDLALIPPIDKQVVRAEQARMVAPRFRGRRLLRPGTSGTTGTAVVVRKPTNVQALHRAVNYRNRAGLGIRVGSRQLRFSNHIGPLGPRTRPPFWYRSFATNQCVLSPTHLTEQSVPIIARWMLERAFDCMNGWPSPMIVLANHILEQGLTVRHRPKLVEFSSEMLWPGGRERLEQVFGAPVLGVYDMTEFAGNMHQCEHGRYHLVFETCCVQTAPVPGAGDGLVKLIFTGWGNPAMPFIRYDVGDLARPTPPGAGPCPCGRQSMTFESIEGRADDLVRTPDGRIAFGINVHLPSAREVQIYQGSLEEIEVRVAPSPDYDAGEEAEMLRRLREYLGPEIRIRIEMMDEIPRSPSGKFRAVVSDLPKSIAGS